MASLRFDFTGLGDSDGDFAATSFSSNIANIECGAAVIAAAARIREARVIVTIAAPSDPSHVIHHFEQRVKDIEREHEAEVDIAGRLFRISKQFLDDIGQFDMEKAIAGLGKTLLVFHSPEDDVVGITHAERLFAFAAYPKSFVVLDGADHLLTRAEDADFVAETIAAWTTRFIHPRARQGASAEADTSGAVIVSETSIGRYALRIRVGRHTLNADEPRALGGDDHGPSPYDLLLASLGSCTAMTIRMYAERKQLALQHVEVRLRHTKIHAQDCADCETREGRIDVIERVIKVQGDLSDMQRAKLLEIAEKCPVHRTLQGEVKITTRFST